MQRAAGKAALKDYSLGGHAVHRPQYVPLDELNPVFIASLSEPLQTLACKAAVTNCSLSILLIAHSSNYRRTLCRIHGRPGAATAKGGL